MKTQFLFRFSKILTLLVPSKIKPFVIITIFLLTATSFHSYAQETYGNSLNLGLGVAGYAGYYRYVGHPLPVFHIDYELGVARNFSLAPFANMYTSSGRYYWGNDTYPADYYTYREVVIPVGIKGTYYFDALFQAGTKWDFYAAGSLGFSIVSRQWESGYYGDKNHFHRGVPLFLDAHIGAEYHF